MKKSILWLGLGQAGGNIAQLAENNGYNVLCMNTSQQDLDTLSVKHTYHITNGDGCSKNRDLAKELIKADFANVRKIVDKFMGDVKIIIVTFAAGGGSGSGCGPALARFLTALYPNVIVCMAVILPAMEESFTANANSYECFQDILKVEKSGAVFVLDNQEFANRDDINRQFIADFNDFIAIPEKDKSTSGIIDPSEIRTALAAHGMATLVSVPNCENNLAALFKSLNDGIFAPPEKDNMIEYAAVSIGDKSIKENQIKQELQKSFGLTRDNFITYNDRNTTICLLSGLTYPMTRLTKIADYVAEHKNLVEREAMPNIELTADMSFLKKDRKKPAKAIEAKDELDAIWDDFM